MAEFPLPVLQIWRSRKRVAIQIQLMNIHVSECKYYCLHLVPKFGDMCDRQNWRLHPTADWYMWNITDLLPDESCVDLTYPDNMLAGLEGLNCHTDTMCSQPVRVFCIQSRSITVALKGHHYISFFITLHKFWLVWKNIMWLCIHNYLACIHNYLACIHN